MAEAARRERSKAEVPLLTALAAYNIAVALRVIRDAELEAETPERLFEEATVLLNDAERYDQTDLRVLLRKGLLLLAQGKSSQAEYLLKSLVARFPDNVAAHLALGVVAFGAGAWDTALPEFQMALRCLPSCPESVRVAIGQCLLRLGREQAAQAVFERVLGGNGGSVDALLGLATIHLNQGPKMLPKAMQLLKQAYDLDRSNPTVLHHLANHFFFKKDYSKAATLAHAAIQNAAGEGRESVRAQALYVLGKVQHAQQAYAEAFESYSEAVKLDPDHALAQLGLGQLCIQRGDMAFAAECFARVVKLEEGSGGGGSSPRPIDDAEFWSMMGMVGASQVIAAPPGEATRSAVEATKQMLDKAVSLGDASLELFLAMAMLYETRDPREALRAYECARAADPEGQRFSKDPELLNNYGVTLHLNGRLEEARAAFEQAAAVAGGELALLCRSNEARLCQDLGRLQEAEGRYRELLKASPNDAILHLRLGLICAQRGQHGEAADHYKEAIGVQEAEVDGWVLLACSHLRVKALTPARKAFERILKQNDRHDAFSLVALGIIYVEIGRHERRSAAFAENMRRALEFFIKALQLQPSNYVAANGVGSVLAELGRWKEAKDVFLQVKQGAPAAFTDATLNLAHCFVELGQFGAAQHAYESVLGQVHGKRRASVLLFLARSYYAQAKAERTPAIFERAIGCLQEAAALLPDDLPIRFNIGLCQQEVAAVTVKRGAGGASTEEEGRRALALLDSAAATFRTLLEGSQAPEGGSTGNVGGVDLKIVEQRAKYCQSLRQSLIGRLDSLRTSESSRQAKLEAVRQQREEQLAVEAARRAQEEAARQEEEARHEAIRRELAARMRTTEERVQAAAERASDDTEGSEEEGGARGRRQRRSQRAAGSGGRRPRRAATSEQDDEDQMEMFRGRKRLSRGGMQLSKDFISSDSGEEEEADAVMTSDHNVTSSAPDDDGEPRTDDRESDDDGHHMETDD